MHISRLAMTDFRNHASTQLTPGKGLNILVGPNGAGKTNILEAVSLLSPGRGLRGASTTEMSRDGSGKAFTVAAHCNGDDPAAAEIVIGTAARREAMGRRQVRVNAVDVSATSLGEWLSVLWLTPAMDRLFVEAASQRRKFLDRLTLALVPGHAHHSSRYEAAMRSRTRLLISDAPADPQWLDALEAQMAEHGEAIDAARHALIRQLTAVLAMERPGPFAVPRLGLIDSSGAKASLWAAEALRAALLRSRHIDAVAGRALVGPHRVDMAVAHVEKDQPAGRCSTGEQKAMLLSIVLAHGDLVATQRGARPVLLLDELAAHLDPERRAALFARLAATGGQVWMTGTEITLFDAAPDDAARWLIEAGGVPQEI
ncbi:MAG: DNA replication/repair protein RecF [Sphingopyxis sp.]